MVRRAILIAVAVLAVAGMTTGAATATPSSGVTVLQQTRISAGSFDIVTQLIMIAPGGTTGWHSHPGATTVVMRLGELTLYHADCTSVEYRAGAGFRQPANEPHVARNETSTPLIFYTYYLLPPGAPVRVDQPNPGCPVS